MVLFVFEFKKKEVRFCFFVIGKRTFEIQKVKPYTNNYFFTLMLFVFNYFYVFDVMRTYLYSVDIKKEDAMIQ